MLRSLYAGISGLKNFQTQLDVIGNNLANVSAFGFKKSRVNFQDILSQEQSGASAPTATKGGINPIQVGLGSTVGSIDTIDTQGNLQTTGRNLDLAITGDGYFNVQNGSQSYYTRAGNFYLDASGNLVTSGGEQVLGYSPTDLQTGITSTTTLKPLAINDTVAQAAPPTSTASMQSFSIGSDGIITAVMDDGTTKSLGQIALSKFSNPGGLVKSGGSLYQSSGNSGKAVVNPPGQKGSGALQAGELEMSNVDMAEEFTGMIEAQRGFQANAKTITTADQILQTLVNLKQ